MSNLAGVTKDMYPEGTVATTDGLTGPDGVALVTVPVTEAEVHAFNGTSPAPKAEKKAKKK
jgi:hypothetical protein|tara:strand:+ start:2496 stop:2678 length:183 start_codon:yes stop_codon:yes gene_type:complete